MKEPYTMDFKQFTVTIDPELGHIAVEHDGTITWDDLFTIKNAIWGVEARAIEVYPRQSDLVNSTNCRHLWRLGDKDFCPDLLGPVSADDTLKGRYVNRWAEAGSVWAKP